MRPAERFRLRPHLLLRTSEMRPRFHLLHALATDPSFAMPAVNVDDSTFGGELGLRNKDEPVNQGPPHTTH